MRKKLSGKRIYKILLKNGWSYHQMKGSHMVLQKREDGQPDKYIHVPIKMKIASPNIIRHIEKKTGVVLE